MDMPQSIEEIVAYATGYKTLSGAPYINPDTLKAKGFTQEAIEIGRASCRERVWS
jgi:ribonucleoside-diphosphate reductase alpha chain